MVLKLKVLEQTQAFYNWELKKEGLTEKERASYLLAKRSIEKIIKEKERAGETEKPGEKRTDILINLVEIESGLTIKFNKKEGEKER